MKIAVLVASRNRPDLVEAMAEQLERSMTIPYDLFVVECGTDRDKISQSSTLWYADPDFRGKCFAHNFALQAARLQDRYDYYWILMNDIVFDPGVDAARVLVKTMEENARMAILSPTNIEGGYPGADRQQGGSWRKVTTCDYLGFMMRSAAVDDVGFLNPEFRYCWGAIHELAYKLYRSGWFVAYSDEVSYRHLGGSTYGAQGTNTISREEYQRRAKRFAYDYFRETHGDNWNEVFWSECSAHEIEIDTFAEHKALWASGFTQRELLERGGAAPRADVPAAKRMLPEDRPGARRLHLGCGTEYREGWINVDTNPNTKTDVVSRVEFLPMFADGSVGVIEACHLFEHLTYHEALAALKEWSRILEPGGELFLEMPDLDGCIRILGKHTDDRGFDLGLIGLYGWPPAIQEEGVPQIHKWGWSRSALAHALREVGFDTVEFGPITQTWRVAAKTNRDFRVRAAKAVAVVSRGAQTTASGSEKESGPIATRAALRVLAWPCFDDPAELDTMFDLFGRPLVGREDAGLCLIRDPEIDGDRDTVLEALERSHARTLGVDADLQIFLIDDPLAPEEWVRLGRSLCCTASLPSSESEPRRSRIAEVGARIVRSTDELLSAILTATVPQNDVPETADAELLDEIEALHPWFYPATIQNQRVTPGIGTHLSPEYLEHRIACRAKLLNDEVGNRIDFKGKSILDLGCNCGYWSARYAERGAVRVVGIEGRDLYRRQAELYWSRNDFLPKDAYRFLQGDVGDPSAWTTLRELGPYDVTLCAGILCHVANYRDILRWASEVTREVLIVDTRVGDSLEQPVTEPGDLHFNAIPQSLTKVVPNLDKLLALLRELGMEPEVLPVTFPVGLGVEDDDDYAAGKRVTIVARKVRVLNDVAAALPVSAPHTGALVRKSFSADQE